MNPFGTAEMAAGYAASRPPIHLRVIEQVSTCLGRTRPFRLALDIGCGAGVSTSALAGYATTCVGLEPMDILARRAPSVAPFASFIIGAAEAIPLCDGSADLITAAGSLNYVDLDRFFPEAARVLARDGVLLVYDFSPGRDFRGAPGLDNWFSGFYTRYPPPANEARALDPQILDEIAPIFRLDLHDRFELGIPLTLAFYLDYMMTETNVAAAVRRGIPLAEIKSWCAETLVPVWSGAEREVLFRGYFACMIVP